jgi:hypothetical protein
MRSWPLQVVLPIHYGLGLIDQFEADWTRECEETENVNEAV